MRASYYLQFLLGSGSGVRVEGGTQQLESGIID